MHRSEKRGFYIQFIPEDFEDIPDQSGSRVISTS
jgi:hypothetical protein